MSEKLILYVSEHCAWCDGAYLTVKSLAQEFSLPFEIISIDQTPIEGLPAVPAVYYQGVLYVGHRFAQRLWIALEHPMDLSVGQMV